MNHDLRVAERPAGHQSHDIQSRPVLPVAAWSATMQSAPRDQALRARPLPIRLRPRTPVPVYPVPGGAPFALLPVQIHPGLPTWLPVVDERHGWVQVLLPTRPDGAVGWLKRDDRVELAEHPTHIEIDTSARSVTLHHGRNLLTWPAGVGRATTPTPHGRTFVLGEIHPARGLVDRALLLASHMRTHLAWGAGIAAVGLHTWPGATRGLPATDGSVVLPPEAIPVLAVCAAPGTPVLIR
ncbi:L,D-transpeptidase [Amycolatopsis sp. NPDC004378]